MPERTDQPTDQDSPEPPSESTLISEPATVEACAADYAAGASARDALDKHVRKYRDR